VTSPFPSQTTEGRRYTELRRRYGITPQFYDELLLKQDYKCAICRKPSSECRKGLSIDHDHATGKVRGLLCQGCNIAVGVVEVGKVEAVEKYLAEHRK
jgi:5-methylcytosine-specific restriction endonuclease McrA